MGVRDKTKVRDIDAGFSVERLQASVSSLRRLYREAQRPAPRFGEERLRWVQVWRELRIERRQRRREEMLRSFAERRDAYFSRRVNYVLPFDVVRQVVMGQSEEVRAVLEHPEEYPSLHAQVSRALRFRYENGLPMDGLLA